MQSSSTRSLRLPIFQISSASFHILSESKQSLSGRLHSCSYVFPPFCNSFTHLTSHSYSCLVLRHQFSHQITKAWCIKIFNKSQGTVISVTAISVSTEMQTYAHTYFKSLKLVKWVWGMEAYLPSSLLGEKPVWWDGGGGREGRRQKEGKKKHSSLIS